MVYAALKNNTMQVKPHWHRHLYAIIYAVNSVCVFALCMQFVIIVWVCVWGGGGVGGWVDHPQSKLWKSQTVEQLVEQEFQLQEKTYYNWHFYQNWETDSFTDDKCGTPVDVNVSEKKSLHNIQEQLHVYFVLLLNISYLLL